MKYLIVFLLLTISASAEDWTNKLSPRMRKAIAPMTAPDWSPRREVELTASEKNDLLKLYPRLADQARELLRAAVQAPPAEPRPPKPRPAD